MSEILYGHHMLESPRRSHRVAASAFENAAGSKQTFADRPEAEPTDRHPDLQRAIKAQPDRRCTRDQIEQNVRGLTGDASASEVSATGKHKSPGGATLDPAALERTDTANALIYHPQIAEPSSVDSPRRLRAPGGKLSTSGSEKAIHAMIFPDHQAASTPRAANLDGEGVSAGAPYATGGCVPITDPMLSACGGVWASGGKSGRRTWAEPTVRAATTQMHSVLYQESADEPVDISEPMSGVMRVRVQPTPAKPHGRATGIYNPSEKDATPRGSLFADAPSDAGVHSSRLHELATCTPCGGMNMSYSCHVSQAQRHRVGLSEGRAGAGPTPPPERRVCGITRGRKPIDESSAPQVVPSQPERSKSPNRGRVHLAPSAAAAKDHLDGRLVPASHGEASKPSGKATGLRARHSAHEAQFSGSEAAFATGYVASAEGGDAWGPAGREQRDVHSCGRRHIETRSNIDMTHPGASEPPRVTAAPGDRSAGAPSVAAAAAAASSRRAQPRLDRQASYRAQADAASAYTRNLMHATTSSIFSDLDYA